MIISVFLLFSLFVMPVLLAVVWVSVGVNFLTAGPKQQLQLADTNSVYLREAEAEVEELLADIRRD